MAVDEREAEEALLRDGEEWWDEGGDYEDDEKEVEDGANVEGVGR